MRSVLRRLVEAPAAAPGSRAAERPAAPDDLESWRRRGPVELVHWPHDEALRRRFAATGTPRLLLVDPEAEVPQVTGLDEDWIRLPADERDVSARLRGLARRAAAVAASAPVLDDAGVLRRGGRTLVLSPAETRLVGALAAQPGRVVARPTLERAVWPEGATGARALDHLAYRLRPRLGRLGLTIRAARRQGFLLDADGPVAPAAPGRDPGSSPGGR